MTTPQYTYTPIRDSQLARYTDHLRLQMENLADAVKRINEGWNDVVAQGVQANQVNQIVSACNAINSMLVTFSTQIDSYLEELKDHEKDVSRVASTGYFQK